MCRRFVSLFPRLLPIPSVEQTPIVIDTLRNQGPGRVSSLTECEGYNKLVDKRIGGACVQEDVSLSPIFFPFGIERYLTHSMLFKLTLVPVSSKMVLSN